MGGSSLEKLDYVEVGLSFSTLDEKVKKDFEPFSSSIERRIKTLKILKEHNIRTYAFLGPILPELTDLREMYKIFKDIKVDLVMAENLNIRAGNWKSIENLLERKYPSLVEKYKQIFFTENNYWRSIEKEIKRLSKEYNIETKIFFDHKFPHS